MGLKHSLGSKNIHVCNDVIFITRYTEHSTVGLAQQWDQLDQLAMRMRHNLEQQIQARKMTGVPEETLKEFAANFR